MIGIIVSSAFVINAKIPFNLFATQGGNVYYVATWGNDTNPGTIEEPWRTIQRAADVMTAGDTVYIMGGPITRGLFPEILVAQEIISHMQHIRMIHQ